MAPVKLILFDLDDTLVHFEDYWAQSMVEAFRRHAATRDLDAEAFDGNGLEAQRRFSSRCTIEKKSP